jgi:hypothetical protein
MKNSLKALVVVAILAIAGMANAQNSASATATANATVVCPIAIHNNTNLEFGTITNSATGGTVVVPANGSATYTNVAATTGSHAGPAPHSADFTISGQGQFFYTVTPTIVTNFAGVGATLSNLTWDNGSFAQIAVFPCDPDNDGDAYTDQDEIEDGPCGCVSDNLKVGGTLSLTSAANGVYVATINVQIAYN